MSGTKIVFLGILVYTFVMACSMFNYWLRTKGKKDQMQLFNIVFHMPLYYLRKLRVIVFK